MERRSDGATANVYEGTGGIDARRSRACWTLDLGHEYGWGYAHAVITKSKALVLTSALLAVEPNRLLVKRIDICRL